MKKIFAILISLLFCHSLFTQNIQESMQVIIKFKAEERPKTSEIIKYQKFEIEKINVLNKRFDVETIKLTGHKKQGDTFVLKYSSKEPQEVIIEAYQKTGVFEYVEPDFIGRAHGVNIIPNDDNFINQWAHFNDGSFSLSNSSLDADIDTDLAWDITQGDSEIIVAILDSGLKLEHPEFEGRIWTNPGENQNGFDSDSNDYIDDVSGWDFAYDDATPRDDHGHGTNVTGIAMASGNNDIGYAGMNWNSKIMVCKILDNSGYGYYTWWAEAIYYAVDNGASVINMSVGGDSPSTLLSNALNYAFSNNVPVVVSTGNQNSVIEYPARYANSIAVGSTDPDDTRTVPFFWDTTTGSSYGNELDFVAPGNYIYGLSHLSNTDYSSYWGGTSQAAPHVTGLISLLLSIDPSLTVGGIERILEESSEDQVGDFNDINGWDQYYGHGRINAFQALLNLSMNVSTAEIQDDTILVYPNPLSVEKLIKISNITDGYYNLRLYNALGQNAYTITVSANNEEIAIQLPDLDGGTYFLRISNTAKKDIILKKVIIE